MSLQWFTKSKIFARLGGLSDRIFGDCGVSVQPTGLASDGTFSQSAALFYGKKFLEAVGYDALYLLTAIDPELETAVITAGELVRKRRMGGSLTDSQSDPEVV